MESKNTLEISDWRFPNDASEEDRLIAMEFIKGFPTPEIEPTNTIVFKWRIELSEVSLEFPKGKVMLVVIRWTDDMDYCKEYLNIKLENPRCTPQFVRAKIREAIDDEEIYMGELADEYRNQAQKGDMI